MENTYSNVYIVVNEGEVVFASVSRELANDYATERHHEGIKDVLEEWGRDNPDEKDIHEASFQAGYNGDDYEVVKVNIIGLSEDGQVELPDETIVDVSTILDKLNE